jgi:hypothetical protein
MHSRTFITPEEFRSWDLFATFEHTAFRLESRDGYAADTEQDSYKEYLAGQADLDKRRMQRSRWLGTMRAAINQGKRVERVRVVPSPLTDALRYEAWEGKLNAEVGEDIRYLDRERARELGIPYLNHDYWLFDSHRLYQLRFDDQDRLTGVEIVDDPEELVRANRHRDAAWHHATPFTQWYAAHADELEPNRAR